jgi:hypothetical protein
MLGKYIALVVSFFLLTSALLGGQRNKQEEDKVKKAGRLVNSTTDANGNQHPGVSSIRPNGTITCTQATQSVNQGQTPACFVVTNSGASTLTKGQNMGTGNGGTMTLTCNGQGRLTCQARIDD